MVSTDSCAASPARSRPGPPVLEPDGQRDAACDPGGGAEAVGDVAADDAALGEDVGAAGAVAGIGSGGLLGDPGAGRCGVGGAFVVVGDAAPGQGDPKPRPAPQRQGAAPAQQGRQVV